MWPFRRRTDDDFRAEIDAHLQLETDRLIADGVAPADARAQARQRFGNITAAQERFYESGRWPSIDDLWRDLKHACRSLARDRRFASVAVVTLALGVGGSITMFATIDTLLLRDLPYRDASRVVAVWQTPADNRLDRVGVAPGVFLDWRDRSTSFADMAALEPTSFDYFSGSEPTTLNGALVTEGFFEVLGVDPLAGRSFAPNDYANVATDVVMLSYGAWQRLFGGDPAIIGRRIPLEGAFYTVIGVLPPWAHAFAQRSSTNRADALQLEAARPYDVWAPKVLRNEERQNRRDRFWNVVARLRPGVTVEQAQMEMSAVADRLTAEYSDALTATVEPLREHLVGRVRTPALVLGGAVAFVLLIACANVANLLLARGASRQRELAIRAAIGATRARLVRQFAIESFTIAAAATALGLAAARWSVAIVSALAAPYVQQLEAIAIDARVVLFSAALAVLSSVLFGTWPAVVWSRPHADARALAAGQTVTRVARPPVISWLVVGEVALTLVLLAGAGLLLRALSELTRTDPGFERSNVAVLQVFAYGPRYPGDAQRVAFFEEAQARMGAVPGVESVGLVSAMPFGEANIGIRSDLQIVGREPARADERLTTFATVATPDYFRAMRAPLRAGRALASVDRAGAPPVALVNDVLARQYWRGSDPVGARITVRWLGRPWTAEVVGVVAGLRHEGLDRDARPEVFLPFAQRPFGSMTFVVRTSADPAPLLPALKAEVWKVDPTLPFYHTATLDALVGRSLSARRFVMALLAVFAIGALLLAMAGLYGLLSFTTAQRRRELSVRVAIGAPASHIVRLVVGQGLALIAAGVVFGLGGALLLGRVLRSLLHTVSPADPGALAATTAILIAVAALACYVPAHRAARADPLLAMRAE